MREEKIFRTKVSQGYQVAVPAELRKRYGVDVGDEVIWILEDNEVRTNFRRRPSLENIASIGRSGRKESAVELKKKVQRGEV
jgi:bifunctional DNA-binding transcriptional regulator/antitoxin component of YhaV-PrlF toxin-antitoxin module